MSWLAPHAWRIADGTPTHTIWNQDLISNPASLRNENDARVKVYRSSNLSVANDTRQDIAWNAQVYESSGMYDAGANTRLIALRDGIYLIQAKVGWANNATGRRGIGYNVNGVNPDYDLQFNSANGNAKENGADLLKLAAGDYISVFAYQSSGGALNLLGSNEGSSSATLTLLATPTAAPPWTAPRTWTDGDILTPHLLQTQWSDNLNNLRYFRGQAAKVSLAENQSVTAQDRKSALAWDTENFRIGSLWTGGSKFTAQIAGWYLVIATVEWRSESTAAVGALRGVGYKINGSSISYDLHFQSGSQSGVSTNGKGMAWLNRGDFLEIYAYHDAEQSLTINGGGVDKTRACVALMAA